MRRWPSNGRPLHGPWLGTCNNPNHLLVKDLHNPLGRSLILGDALVLFDGKFSSIVYQLETTMSK
jgi:hypothetical protein